MLCLKSLIPLPLNFFILEVITMNELRNIKMLFDDVGLPVHSNLDENYLETDIASLQCISEFVNINHMIGTGFAMYINYDNDSVIFDTEGQEYLGYWR